MAKIGLEKLRGIVPVLQTPFDAAGQIVWDDLSALIEDAIAAGAVGFLAPAVASEVDSLSQGEREQLLRFVANQIRGRAGLIAGCSAPEPATCREYMHLAFNVGATAGLIAAPGSLLNDATELTRFLQTATAGCEVPLIVQDLDWNGYGLSLETIAALRQSRPTLAGLKIETVPAGPKYTAVRERFGPDFHIAGGWAVPQMIEALDRGIDAMIPEASMVHIYVRIHEAYRQGRRNEAIERFRQLLPILAFTNQEIRTSIAFFKRLLVRRGIFKTASTRPPHFEWDSFNERIADELIEHYLQLESSANPN